MRVLVFLVCFFSFSVSASPVSDAEKEEFKQFLNSIQAASQTRDVSQILSFMDKSVELSIVTYDGTRLNLNHDEYKKLLNNTYATLSNYNYRLLDFEVSYGEQPDTYVVTSEVKEMFFINKKYIKFTSKQTTWVKRVAGKLLAYKIIAKL